MQDILFAFFWGVLFKYYATETKFSITQNELQYVWFYNSFHWNQFWQQKNYDENQAQK